MMEIYNLARELGVAIATRLSIDDDKLPRYVDGKYTGQYSKYRLINMFYSKCHDTNIEIHCFNSLKHMDGICNQCHIKVTFNDDSPIPCSVAFGCHVSYDECNEKVTNHHSYDKYVHMLAFMAADLLANHAVYNIHNDIFPIKDSEYVNKLLHFWSGNYTDDEIDQLFDDYKYDFDIIYQYILDIII